MVTLLRGEGRYTDREDNRETVAFEHFVMDMEMAYERRITK